MQAGRSVAENPQKSSISEGGIILTYRGHDATRVVHGDTSVCSTMCVCVCVCVCVRACGGVCVGVCVFGVNLTAMTLIRNCQMSLVLVLSFSCSAKSCVVLKFASLIIDFTT